MNVKRNQKIGTALRRARIKTGISLREVARRLELSPSHVSKIERGECDSTRDTLESIAVEVGF